MKTILLVEPFVPYPLNSGGAQAIYNGIVALKGQYRIFITFTGTVRDEDVQSFCDRIGRDVIVIPRPLPPKSKPLKWKNRLALSLYYRTKSDRISVVPFEEKAKEELFPNYYLEFIHQIILENKIDIVQVEMPWIMSLVVSLPEHVKKVFVHHELRFVRNGLELLSKGENLYRKAAVSVNKILEIGLLNQYDAIITLSETDSVKLKKAGVVRPVYTSFAIVDTPPISRDVQGLPHVLSFVGPEFHTPNKVGVDWFLSECWSQLVGTDSDYRLQIIGKWSEETKRSIQEKYSNVEFMGFVNDLHRAIKGTIMIVPITIGSGIRMKILEAAACRVPFVSTSIGAEGLPFLSGTDCYIQDSPEGFVEAIKRLQNQDLQHYFISNAYRKIGENYNLDALRENRLRILNSLYNKK